MVESHSIYFSSVSPVRVIQLPQECDTARADFFWDEMAINRRADGGQHRGLITTQCDPRCYAHLRNSNNTTSGGEICLD